MNQEETLALWKQGKEAWNAWAHGMLLERETLKQRSQWAEAEEKLGGRWGETPQTQDWFERATAVFSTEDSPKMFESSLDFAGWLFPGDTFFKNCHFSQLVDFSRCRFQNTLWLNNSVFDTTVYFNDLNCSGKVVAAETRFNGDATFSRSFFSKSLTFRRSHFSCSCNLENCQIIGEMFLDLTTVKQKLNARNLSCGSAMDLSHSRFSDQTDFSNSQFGGALSAQKVRFGSALYFNTSQFKDDVDFSESTFEGTAYWINCKFKTQTKFMECEFNRHTSFEHSEFSGNTNFIGSSFRDGVIFVRVSLKGEENHFARSKFYASAIFAHSTVKGTFYFVDSRVDGTCSFDSVSFDGISHFQHALFEKLADFSNCVFNQSSYFKSATFLSNAIFNAIFAHRAFNLANSRFETVPDFTQAHFEEAPLLDNVQIRPVSYQKVSTLKKDQPELSKQLTTRYRALKRLAIQAHDHRKEVEFFAEEMRSLRFFNSKKLTGQWIVSYIYGLISDYGRSLIRPVCAGVLSSILFAYLYLFFHLPPDTYWPTTYNSCWVSGENPIPAAIGLSIRQALLFAGLSNPDQLQSIYTCLYGLDWELMALASNSEIVINVPKVVTFLGSIQITVSATFVFLFVLAIRNKFKIK